MKSKSTFITFVIIAIIGLFSVNYVFRAYFVQKDGELHGKIQIPEGYEGSIALKGLVNPVAMAINREGDIFVGENIGEKGRVIKYSNKGEYSVVIPETSAIITDIVINRETLYISQQGMVTKFVNGDMTNIITGLPSMGDYANNGIMFGNDGLLYICQGAATNSGIVGLDNYKKGWLIKNPYFHDYPPSDLVLSGVNFNTSNPLTINKNRISSTGAFLPFNANSIKGEQIKGRVPGNASVARVSTYGQVEDTFAYGIRNPVGITATTDGNTYISVQGMENRGSRPFANGRDYIYEIKKGDWLGWPDYEGGEPVTNKKFKVMGTRSYGFILDLHPSNNPVKPLTSFKESGRIGLIDTCSVKNNNFKDKMLIPLKKGVKEPSKIVAYNLKDKTLEDIVINAKNSDFINNPVQCYFSKKGELYILENSKGIVLKITSKASSKK